MPHQSFMFGLWVNHVYLAPGHLSSTDFDPSLHVRKRDWGTVPCPSLFQIHSKTPHVDTVLWLDSDDVATILSPTSGTIGLPLVPLVALVEGYKTVYLCHLDSYTVTVCIGYLVSSHVVTVQLLTRCLVDRFLHRHHGSWYLITCVSHVVTVSGTREQWQHRHSGSHCA